VFENVPTGTYLVTENAPPNPFRLLSIDCVDPTGNTTTNVTSGTATINVAPGETVSCTYTNVTTATIIVGAVSFQGQDRFSYTIETNPARALETFSILTTPFNANAGFGTEGRSDLLPAVYTIVAQPAPPGWTFTNMQCVSTSGEQHWTISGGTATITLPDGETIRCYYFYVPAAGPGPGPDVPMAIPTLSGPMQLLLAFLLAIAAWGVRRRW